MHSICSHYESSTAIPNNILNLSLGTRFITINEEYMEKQLTVGKLAKSIGLSAKSIRYYEKEKLIPRAARSTAGYRLYGPDVVARLRFIQKAKAIGFSLDDIRRILQLTDKGKPCCEQVFAWSDRKIRELDEQIKFLTGLKKKVQHYQRRWQQERQASRFPEADICGLIEEVELPSEVRS